jgi:hypothetical protein
LFTGAQIGEGPHAQIPEQPGEQLLQIVALIHPVGHQQRQRRPDERHPPDQIWIGELGVVDAGREVVKPRQRLTGHLQGRDHRGDDGSGAGARHPGELIAGGGQCVHGPR